MPLSDTLIARGVQDGSIVIRPFRPACLQPNSYDLHLGSRLAVYRDPVLDAKVPPEVEYREIGEEGFVLCPGELYLGVTEEYTSAADCYVAYLDGKSSAGRLGIWVHITAGGGDAGFAGCWTLELAAVRPVRVYAGMPIAQIRYELLEGAVSQPYGRATSKYQNQPGIPVASLMSANWDEDRRSWVRDE